MVVRKKVPNQAASGADTFNDNLVGRQVTDGTSQLTNTNFELDRVFPEKDSKHFRGAPFSNYLTLDDLKLEDDAVTTTIGIEKKEKIKFNQSTDNGNKSIFGSLKSRIQISINRIISKFPAGILVDSDSIIRTLGCTATGVMYNIEEDITEFTVESSLLYNPFEVLFETPNGSPLINSENPIRNFFSSYTKYIIELNGKTFDILEYDEPNGSNIFKLKVTGNPFSGQT